MNLRGAMIGGGVLAVLGLLAVLLIPRNVQTEIDQTAAYTVPYRPAMTIEEASQSYEALTPSLLYEVYAAFALTEEEAIYDTLAIVTAGEALEFLYLERVGAMEGGGLDEADQEIHNIELVSAASEQDGMTLRIAATWQVIGTVGHAEHMHVRGNTYSANLTVTPVDGAWKIADFDLLEVNRDSAGELFPATDGADG